MVSVVVSAFIIIFLYQPVRVEGTSMLPMLEDQDRLFINKLAYRVGDIQRGDVVVFLYPHDHEKSYIKRVIALPGDTLRIDHGQVYVNGKVDEADIASVYLGQPARIRIESFKNKTFAGKVTRKLGQMEKNCAV